MKTVHKKKIFKNSFRYRFMLNFDPIYGARVMILTNLNIHILRMFYMKYQSSGTYSSQEENV